MSHRGSTCSVCRFLRGLAFSALGGGLAGYGALGLGFNKENAIVAAFFGALAAVLWAGRRFDRR